MTVVDLKVYDSAFMGVLIDTCNAMIYLIIFILGFSLFTMCERAFVCFFLSILKICFLQLWDSTGTPKTCIFCLFKQPLPLLRTSPLGKSFHFLLKLWKFMKNGAFFILSVKYHHLGYRGNCVGSFVCALQRKHVHLFYFPVSRKSCLLKRLFNSAYDCLTRRVKKIAAL